MPKTYTVTKDDLISEVIKRHPVTGIIMEKYGLHCITCPLREFETIEIGSAMHGLSEIQTQKMIAEINLELQMKPGK